MYPHGLSGGARTHGLLLPKQALCQLSYTQIETAMKASQHRWQTFTYEMLPSDTREVSAPVRQRRSSFWAGVLKPKDNYTADPLGFLLSQIFVSSALFRQPLWAAALCGTPQTTSS